MEPSADPLRLLHPRLALEHIRQVSCDADQVAIRTLLNQPTKPLSSVA